MVYPVRELCPVLPGVQVTVAWASPPVATTFATGPGSTEGVAGTRGAERALHPVALSDWMEM